MLGRNKRSVWKISTKPFKGAHFATFPETLIEIPIKAGCPEMICRKCQKAKEKILKTSGGTIGKSWVDHKNDKSKGMMQYGENSLGKNKDTYKKEFIGYTDCGCNSEWEPGVVLDPFMGAGTTAVVAERLGRRWLGIELNPEYINIAEKRIRESRLTVINSVKSEKKKFELSELDDEEAV